MNKEQIINELTKELPLADIKMDEPMKKHTSFKIGGNADVFITVGNIEELQKIIKYTKDNNVLLKVIGNGTNLLVKDNGFRGIILKLNLQEIKIEEDKEKYIVSVQSGVLLGKLAQELLKKEVGGFEFASGIPGTIGGAIKMNAGAYGGEFKDIVQEVTYLNEKNEIVKIPNEKCDFTYRHSIFSDNNYIILGCNLKLYRDNKENIKKNLEENLQKRKEKQPMEFPSAGSIFKRGENYITAKLIDECGLKGYRVGGAQVSKKHAGFVINTGDATANDVIELIEHVKKVVYEKTENKINLEIEIIGE